MSERIVEVEADSLEEAREKVRSQIPEGLRLLSEEVVSDGNPKTLHGVADTIEGAFEQGLSRIPPSASIVQKEVTVSPTVQTVTVEAFDEQTAMRLVEQRAPPYAKITGLVLKTQGRKGFLGIGKKRPDYYEAQVLPMAIVKITYKEKVKIRATIGKEKPNVEELKRKKELLLKRERKRIIRALDFPYPAVATGEEWAPILHQKLTEKHGKVIEVNVPGFTPEVTFADGTVYELEDYGIGYYGTGARSFAAFLQAAGFKVSREKVAKMKPPIHLECKKTLKVLRRFIDNGVTVTDTVSGLQWQKEDDGIERNYEDAQIYTEGLRLAGYDDWRLPRKEELMELAKLGYKILKQVFPNIKAERYWAKTSREELHWARNPDKIAYVVDFDPSGNYGADVTYFRSYEYYVRAVRNK